MMGTTKYDIEKFTGQNDSGLWRLEMRALLVHQGLGEKNLPETMDEKDKKELLQKAHSAIFLSLGNKVL